VEQPNVKSGKEKIEGAVGKPEDIAAAVAFLASDEARFITGTLLVVDGGRLDILWPGREGGWPAFSLPPGREQLSHDRMGRSGGGAPGEERSRTTLDFPLDRSAVVLDSTPFCFRQPFFRGAYSNMIVPQSAGE
jgi:hypothetical protein